MKLNNLQSVMSSLAVLSVAEVNGFIDKPSWVKSLQEFCAQYPVTKTQISASVISLDPNGSVNTGRTYSVAQAEITQEGDNPAVRSPYTITVGSGAEGDAAKINLAGYTGILGFAVQVSQFNTDFPMSRVRLQWNKEANDEIYMVEFNVDQTANVFVPFLRRGQRFTANSGCLITTSASPAPQPVLSEIKEDVFIEPFVNSVSKPAVISGENVVIKIKPVPAVVDFAEQIINAADAQVASVIASAVKAQF